MVLLGTAAAVIVAAGLRSVAWLIAPAFLALVIVIAVAPVQRWFRRHGWPRWAVTIVLVVAVYGVVLAIGLTIGVSVARFATALPEYTAGGRSLAEQATGLLAQFGVGPDQLRQIRDSLDPSQLSGLIAGLLGSVASLATNLVFILTLLLFLSVETGSVATGCG
ncbi:hypothetical protein BJF78_08555 [Pseudonocardia sp. CNS-139]|nr:hypothetical protein BJF78_08555 [Pseudonocardia sp. CNS-139]